MSTVYDHFLATIAIAVGPSIVPAKCLASYAVGTDTFGAVMKEMPLESPCGDECRGVIDTAAKFCRSIRETFGYDKSEHIVAVLAACCDVVACLIRG